MTIPPPEPSNPYEAPYSPGQPPASPPPYGAPTPPDAPYGVPTPPAAPYGSATPPAAAYGASPYGYTPPAAPPSSGQNGLALAGMITGIVSVLLGCCCGLFGIPVSAVAIVLSVIGMNQIKTTGQAGKPFAIAGIATGAAGILIGIAITVFNFTGPNIMDRFN